PGRSRRPPRARRRRTAGWRAGPRATGTGTPRRRSLYAPAVAISTAILGPGGVGGLLAGALERAGAHPTLLARATTAAELREHGLRVESVVLGEPFTVHPQ